MSTPTGIFSCCKNALVKVLLGSSVGNYYWNHGNSHLLTCSVIPAIIIITSNLLESFRIIRVALGLFSKTPYFKKRNDYEVLSEIYPSQDSWYVILRYLLLWSKHIISVSRSLQHYNVMCNWLLDESDREFLSGKAEFRLLKKEFE